MRKLIVSIHSTANDIVTGSPPDETNFGVWTQEASIEEASRALLKTLATVDTILLGRGTYEDLSRKWPHAKDWPEISEVGMRLAEKINSTPKVVVTSKHTTEDIKWGDFKAPSLLTGQNIEEQIRALKAGDGGHLITFGSPILVQSLTNAGLVDEYQIFVHPVVMHEGRRLFENLDNRRDFRLLSVEAFASGTMFVTYDLSRSQIL